MSQNSWSFLVASALSFLLVGTVLSQSSKTERVEKSFTLDRDETYEINIELDAADVILEKADEPRQVTFVAALDPKHFDVKSHFDKHRRRLTIEITKEKWFSHDSDRHTRVRIKLPYAAPIVLNARIKAGDVAVDLGDISLLGLRLATWAGSVSVDFAEANRATMDYLRINTKVGETEVMRLGNARCHDVDINAGIGDLRVDFRGSTAASGRASIDLDIGSTLLRLPEALATKVRVSGLPLLTRIDLPVNWEQSGRYYYSRNYNNSQATLDLKVSQGMGDLSIE